MWSEAPAHGRTTIIAKVMDEPMVMIKHALLYTVPQQNLWIVEVAKCVIERHLDRAIGAKAERLFHSQVCFAVETLDDRCGECLGAEPVQNQLSVVPQHPSKLLEGPDVPGRSGAYWGIRTNITDYPLADPLPCPHDVTVQLAAVPTRLARMDDRLQERLINWGWAVTDAGIRAHLDTNIPRADFPYPHGVQP